MLIPHPKLVGHLLTKVGTKMLNRDITENLQLFLQILHNNLHQSFWNPMSLLNVKVGMLFWIFSKTYRWPFLKKEQKLLPKLTSKMKSFISKTISVKSQWFRIYSVQKTVQYQSKGNIALWNKFRNEISRKSNFQMWVWRLIFVPFSEKVTCI